MSNTHSISIANGVIQTTVTKSGTEVDSWVRSILTLYGGIDMIVGLDCEWRPTFISGTSNTTATLQLCIGTKCLILQLFYMDYIPQSFKDFLRDPSVTFVGVEVDGDVLKLSNEYGLRCKNTSDIRDLAYKFWPNRWYKKPGLKALASEIVGLYMPKPKHVCQSNWEARNLSIEQLEYATLMLMPPSELARHSSKRCNGKLDLDTYAYCRLIRGSSRRCHGQLALLVSFSSIFLHI